MSSKAKGWAAAIGLIIVVSGLMSGGGEDKDSCEYSYRHDYVFYGTPDAMSLERYCKNFNDTSWLDDMPEPGSQHYQ